MPVVRPDGVIVKNEVVVEPVKAPEPARTMTEAVVAVLFVTVKEAALSSSVTASALSRKRTSPFVTVKMLEPSVPSMVSSSRTATPVAETDQVPLVPRMSEPVPTLVI